MQQETISVDIVGIGAGVATLSTILRLLKNFPSGGSAQKPTVMILEKGSYVGAHVLSGAIIDPANLSALLTPEEIENMPRYSKVSDETVSYLTPHRSLKFPYLPPIMRAHGYPIVSLSQVTKYLGELAEKYGAEIYCETTAVSLRTTPDGVLIKTGDKGVNKLGQPKSNYEPGAEILAKAVVLGEGAFGLISEQVIKEKQLGGPNPQSYALGIKEVIELPEARLTPGAIYHTFGYPLDYFTYGGGFLYSLKDNLLAVGLAVGLDYQRADLNPHDLFRIFKNHPMVKEKIDGGKVLQYGAKVIPEGGIHAIPQLFDDRLVIVGDSAGLVDSLRLKGIHIAMESGLAAGDTLYEAWQKGDYTRATLGQYAERMHKTSGWKQLQRIKNVRAAFDYGILPGMASIGAALATGGRLPPWRFSKYADYRYFLPLKEGRPTIEPPTVKSDLNIDRTGDLYFSGTEHEEDQPCHLKIQDRLKCSRQCFGKYGAPCIKFCPATVYNIEKPADTEGTIRIDAANCLHCKTCEIKDPLRNIKWTAPEAGGGPKYTMM